MNTNKMKAKPNIIFILSDDQGVWALGCSGNKEMKTPNLDYLAQTGIRFENYFCTSPVCSPARASLLTGRMPSQHGILDWLREGNTGGEAIEYLEGQPAYTDILAQNGYTCGISGKWHMGYSEKPQKSFEHWYVHQKGGGPYYNAPMIKEGKLTYESEYITDVITDDALAFIEKCDEQEQPFYLSVHYTAPHSPWINNHPEEYLQVYDDCVFESCPNEAPHPWGWYKPYSSEEERREVLKGYYASITAMDINIGRLIKKLDELGLRDNTLICFMSDNGFNMGHHGVYGKGNGTFPQNMYDTSVKVPAIFSHPGHIPQNIVSDALLSGYDFMPTLLDYVGLSDLVPNSLPGKSFLPILQGKDMREHENVVIYDEYGPVRMVRTKEWKYIHRYPYGPHELYNLVNDPNEANNLVEHPDKQEIITIMKAQLEAWFVKYVDPNLDGTHEAVRGHGQIGMAGPAGKGKEAFQQYDLDHLS